MKRALSFVANKTKWVLSGMPYRTESEIEGIFKEICMPCASFRGTSEIGKCNKCGCPLRKRGNVMNKIAWATTRCPEGKW